MKPAIAIVGPGRAGSAIARGLKSAGYPISAVHYRHLEHAQPLAEAVQATATRSAAGALDLADLTVLAVPDDSIAALAADIADYQCSSAGKAVVHLSGAQDRAPLGALKATGLRTGVFHPLRAFARDAEADFRAPTLFGVDADPPLKGVLEQMARDLGGEPVDLNGVDRSRYHAAAVLVSNFSVTLFAEAATLMEEAGIPPAKARQGLLALLRSTLDNLVHSPAATALTGPTGRGDTATIRRHLEALASDPELQELYRLLAARTARLAGSAPAPREDA